MPLNKQTRLTNALANEKSPYLLQHAHNPVHWYPWSDEAFALAREQDKPVFLSIGYSTCHWCHVMAHDSFENEDVAAILNEHYISIKVDREERPDIDKVYMDVCQAMTGSGGWPLTVLMTPDKKPFFAATFIPSDDKYGMRGLKSILAEIDTAWHDRRDEIIDSTNKILEFINRPPLNGSGTDVDLKTMERAFDTFSQLYDSRYGGFGGQGPKFPQSHQYTFLLRYWRRTGMNRAVSMAKYTLERMARGGMYDQLGGGFHRYSVDEKWLVPHFEKMLYDQGILARTYLEAYQATGEKEFEDVARDIFRYVLRDLKSHAGAFYSAEDADSEGVEGKFYVWSTDQVRDILGDPDAETVIAYYGMTDGGNFEGANIPHVADPLPVFAKNRDAAEDTIRKRIQTGRKKLFLEREKRIRPHLDDKIITAWNGLMISALAYGAQVLDAPEYAEAAAAAADFILDNMLDDGRLFRRYRDGQAGVPGFLDDYAFFTVALIDLYQATFDPSWLESASKLCDRMIELFWDEKQGAFTFSASDNEKLIKPITEAMDGAEPSGNSIAALALARLGRMLMKPDIEKKADRVIRTFSPLIAKYPIGFTQMLLAVDFLLGPGMEAVIAGDRLDQRTRDLIHAVRRHYNPDIVIFSARNEEEHRELEKLTSFVRDKTMLNGQPTAYICRNFSCQNPTHSVAEIAELLEGR